MIENDAGQALNPKLVLSLSTAWACVNLLAGTIGTLPLLVYRRRSDGGREVDTSHPLYRILHDSPNADQTAVDFFEFESASLELWGSAYARKDKLGGRLVGLTPVRPDIMRVSRTSNGALRYRWSEHGQSFDVGAQDVLHVRGFGGAPEGGLSTMEFGGQTFGMARAIDQSAAVTFRNGMRPSFVIAFQEFLSRERREEVHAALEKKFVGAMNSGRPFVAEGGQTVTPLSMKPEDVQMLASRGFSVEEICRLFGVPPFMVGHTEKSTSWGTGIEQQTIGFVKFTLRRRIKRFEQAIMKQLLTPEDRAAGIIVEFSLEGLLRGDSQARSRFYQSGLQSGWLTINEVRALENLPPVEGGDTPRMQMQNVPISEIDDEAIRRAIAQGQD
ncbi:phage portal protein [Pelagibacterium limicola]|uniref:phage portal protein n=1 Tax=Pelagibacterium limicola TaxID=2791022 RepID=UPI0031B5F554